MEDNREKVLIGLEQKILSELRAINEELQKKVTLGEISNNDIEIKMNSGETLILRAEDIEKLKKKVPLHLRSKILLPVEISIIVSENIVKYRIDGDIWQVRMVKYLQSGKLMWKPSAEIGKEELSKLINEYPSLVRLKLIVG